MLYRECSKPGHFDHPHEHTGGTLHVPCRCPDACQIASHVLPPPKQRKRRTSRPNTEPPPPNGYGEPTY